MDNGVQDFILSVTDTGHEINPKLNPKPLFLEKGILKFFPEYSTLEDLWNNTLSSILHHHEDFHQYLDSNSFEESFNDLLDVFGNYPDSIRTLTIYISSQSTSDQIRRIFERSVVTSH